MKHRTSLLALFAVVLAVPAVELLAADSSAEFSFDERELIRKIEADLAAALRESPVPANEPVAILPLGGDREDFALGQFKNAGSAAGRNVVEGRLDPMWEAITQEISWDERKNTTRDVLDPETLAVFGKLQGARMLLYGILIPSQTEDGRARMEATLHVSSVVTKQHLWGKSFVVEAPPPETPWLLYAGIALFALIALWLFLRATTRVR